MVFYFQILFQAVDTFFHTLLYLQAYVEVINSGLTRVGEVRI